ncbi:MAG: hypothetical protein JRE82_11150 [Deltaproteobacteria bacterium]|nr:hypothetical protein [Deltaproteobacteria bacterium]
MQEDDAPRRRVELLKTGEVEVRAAQQADPTGRERDDGQQPRDVVECVDRGKGGPEQEAQQQILHSGHHEEAALQSFHDVVRQNVRNADHDDEQDDRAEIVSAVVRSRPGRRVRDTAQRRPKKRHDRQHQLPPHTSPIVKKKQRER